MATSRLDLFISPYTNHPAHPLGALHSSRLDLPIGMALARHAGQPTPDSNITDNQH